MCFPLRYAEHTLKIHRSLSVVWLPASLRDLCYSVSQCIDYATDLVEKPDNISYLIKEDSGVAVLAIITHTFDGSFALPPTSDPHPLADTYHYRQTFAPLTTCSEHLSTAACTRR
jgi:hypothetical protein